MVAVAVVVLAIKIITPLLRVILIRLLLPLKVIEAVLEAQLLMVGKVILLVLALREVVAV
jgi:hypothetical protein